MLISNKEKILSPPKSYFIELTNRCNLTCTMCISTALLNVLTSTGQKVLWISTSRKDSLNRLPDWANPHGLPCMAGESLLHRESPIEIIRFGSSFKNLNIGLLTNGMLLSTEISRGIIDSGISWIGFSIDGTNKEKFEKYRRGSDYGP